MNKLFLLLKVDLLTYFSVNEFRRGQKKSAKTVTVLTISVFILLLGLYNFANAAQLIQLGQANLILANLLARSSLLVFFLTFFQYNGLLFENRDFERLTVLPLRHEQQVLVKVGFLYLLNLFLTVLFMFPAVLAYLLESGEVSLLLLYFILIPFVPLIPMSLVVLIANGLQAFSSRVKNNPFLSLGLSLLVLFSIIMFMLILTLRFQANHSSQSEIAASLLAQIGRLYPLSYLFVSKHQFFGNSIFFILLSLLTAGISFWIQVKFYRRLCLLSRQRNMRKLSSRRHVRHSILYTLCQKEFRRFFHSYLYMLQGGAGVILLIFLSIGLLVIRPEQIFASSQLALIKEILPFLLASFLVIASPAASALSLEGTSCWILASLPISQKQIIQSKLSVSLILSLLTSLLILPIFVLRFGLDWAQIFFLLLTLFSYGLFTAVQGLYCNLLFPRFDWEAEVLVLKQSKAVLFSSLIGGLSLLLPLVLSLLQISRNILILIVSSLLLFASYYLYQLMLKKSYLFAVS